MRPSLVSPALSLAAAVFLTSLSFQSAFAYDVYRANSKALTPAVSVPMDPDALFISETPDAATVYPLRTTLIIANGNAESAVLSQALLKLASFDAFRAYSRDDSGSDQFLRDGSLYGTLQTTLTKPADSARLLKILSSKAPIEITLIDGTHDEFWIELGSTPNCSWYRNGPLWTFRLRSVDGTTFDFAYEKDLLLTGVTAAKHFPALRTSSATSASACKATRTKVLAAPDAYLL